MRRRGRISAAAPVAPVAERPWEGRVAAFLADEELKDRSVRSLALHRESFAGARRDTASAIEGYLKERGSLITSRLFVSWDERPLCRHTVHGRFREYAAAAAVKASPHSLRHTFARMYLMGGGDAFSLHNSWATATPPRPLSTPGSGRTICRRCTTATRRCRSSTSPGPDPSVASSASGGARYPRAPLLRCRVCRHGLAFRPGTERALGLLPQTVRVVGLLQLDEVPEGGGGFARLRSRPSWASRNCRY